MTAATTAWGAAIVTGSQSNSENLAKVHGVALVATAQISLRGIPHIAAQEVETLLVQ